MNLCHVQAICVCLYQVYAMMVETTYCEAGLCGAGDCSLHVGLPVQLLIEHNSEEHAFLAWWHFIVTHIDCCRAVLRLAS